jgi:hypothetical protein
MIKDGPVLGGHHPERGPLGQCDERLGDPDPFRQFPEAHFWITSGSPTTHSEPILRAAGESPTTGEPEFR